jgi:hypothetical protein
VADPGPSLTWPSPGLDHRDANFSYRDPAGRSGAGFSDGSGPACRRLTNHRPEGCDQRPENGLLMPSPRSSTSREWSTAEVARDFRVRDDEPDRSYFRVRATPSLGARVIRSLLGQASTMTCAPH